MHFKILITSIALAAIIAGCSAKENHDKTAENSQEPAKTHTTDNNNGNVADDMGNAVKDTTDGAGEAVKDVGTGVGDATKEVADSVGNAVKDVGDGMNNATDNKNN